MSFQANLTGQLVLAGGAERMNGGAKLAFFLTEKEEILAGEAVRGYRAGEAVAGGRPT